MFVFLPSLQSNCFVRDLCSFQEHDLDLILWWFNGGVTPVLIPNTEVKLASGDGSRGYTR